MTQVQLFNKFKEDHRGINMSITTFMQQKPWYARPITISDTCCCRYHVQFQLYYNTFLEFGKMFQTNSPPPLTIREFISQNLCERNHAEVFYNKNCVNGKHCHGCGNLVLFDNKQPIDNDQSLSNVTIDWRRYEYNNILQVLVMYIPKELNCEKIKYV